MWSGGRPKPFQFVGSLPRRLPASLRKYFLVKQGLPRNLAALLPGTEPRSFGIGVLSYLGVSGSHVDVPANLSHFNEFLRGTARYCFLLAVSPRPTDTGVLLLETPSRYRLDAGPEGPASNRHRLGVSRLTIYQALTISFSRRAVPWGDLWGHAWDRAENVPVPPRHVLSCLILWTRHVQYLSIKPSISPVISARGERADSAFSPT